MAKDLVKRYSESFKRQLVSEYESGESRYQLRRRYGVCYGSQDNWIKKYAKSGLRHKVMRIQKPEEADRVRELESRVAALEKALAQETLDKLMYKTMVEVAGIKKNDAPKSSNAFREKA